MTWTWTLPIHFAPRRAFLSPPLHPARVRVIVPTFRDWEEARMTVESLLECRPRPGEIVLVNDNADAQTPRWVRGYPVHLVEYPGNRGPAHARNEGASLKTRRQIEWFYFTDTGCIRDPGFFSALSDASHRAARTVVALAGPVRGSGASPLLAPINTYMSLEGILMPPADASGPQGLVTANAAVSVCAFETAEGFDRSYPFAAGEDLDLGLRLRALGPIGWVPDAVVTHHFSESLEDFRSRFLRYGKGNAHLSHRRGLPSLRSGLLQARNPVLQYLADLQSSAMREGYDLHSYRLRTYSKSDPRHINRPS